MFDFFIWLSTVQSKLIGEPTIETWFLGNGYGFYAALESNNFLEVSNKYFPLVSIASSNPKLWSKMNYAYANTIGKLFTIALNLLYSIVLISVLRSSCCFVVVMQKLEELWEHQTCTWNTFCFLRRFS